MTALSTAAWTAQELGLATAVGGTMFGRAALQPALQGIEDLEDRNRISSDAWRRFSWMNLAAHGVLAATWWAGRSTRARGSSRGLMRIKDGLVITSLATGVGSMVLGRALGKRVRERTEENVISGANQANRRIEAWRRTVGGLGMLNLLANVALLGISSMLAADR